MNLGDRYLQYQTWKSANPVQAHAAHVALVVIGVFLLGFIFGNIW